GHHTRSGRPTAARAAQGQTTTCGSTSVVTVGPALHHDDREPGADHQHAGTHQQAQVEPRERKALRGGFAGRGRRGRGFGFFARGGFFAGGFFFARRSPAFRFFFFGFFFFGFFFF